jgi:hypothetical protein
MKTQQELIIESKHHAARLWGEHIEFLRNTRDEESHPVQVQELRNRIRRAQTQLHALHMELIELENKQDRSQS